MKTCVRVGQLIALSAGGDLDAGSERALQEHLAGCPGCRAELREYLEVISLGREAFSSEDILPAPVRTRIAARAAESAQRASWRTRFSPLPGWFSGQTGVAATVAAALVVVALALPVSLRIDRSESRGEAVTAGIGGAGFGEVDKIEMRFEDGAVRLAWSDGRKPSYVVHKSSDPRGVTGAETHSVQGNTWVDTNPDSSRVVFYRIE